MTNDDLKEKIDATANMIVASRKLVVFTGAGISTESGIPDFRSPGGIWSKFDPDDFTIQKFLSSPETRKKQWQLLVEGGLIADAEPNQAHLAIAELEKLNRLECVITQNIDNLHQKAGNSPEKVFELHGNMRRVKCLNCGECYPLADIKQRLKKGGENVPDCENCHGILKPDVVFFGEALPVEALQNATYHSNNCDLLIAIGSSLVVYPAAYMPVYAKEAGAKLVIINLNRTSCDSSADICINSKAGETMESILSKVKEKL
ncbi:MAG: NAD-dependent deacylase [Syntrophales bacterium]|nr:NAD-dependent deacylase [Syntrophales bacterium]